MYYQALNTRTLHTATVTTATAMYLDNLDTVKSVLKVFSALHASWIKKFDVPTTFALTLTHGTNEELRSLNS